MPKFKSNHKLPNKPSELLLLALADLEVIETDSNYLIDMITWHSPFRPIIGEPYKCAICLAGAVLAKSFKLKRHVIIDNNDLDTKIGLKLQSLDAFRMGYLGIAFHYLGLKRPESIPVVLNDPTYLSTGIILDNRYSFSDMSLNNREEWKLHMLDLIGILQAEGF